MHGRIYQLSKNKIDEDNYICPEMFYNDCNSFADYIGDEIDGDEDRNNDIRRMVDSLDDVFEIDGDTLIYKGIEGFVGRWIDAIKKKVGEIEDGKYDFSKFYSLENIVKETIIKMDARFYIEDWNDCAKSAKSLVSWCLNELKPGDRVYLGGIIDYHF